MLGLLSICINLSLYPMRHNNNVIMLTFVFKLEISKSNQRTIDYCLLMVEKTFHLM